MDRLFRSPKTLWLSLIALSLAVFLAILAAGRLRERELLDELVDATFSHALYALDQKDDMALVDWGKELERRKGVSAFRLSAASRVAAEGGNLDYLSGPRRPGRVPVIRLRENKAESVRLEIVHAPNHAPILWGLLGVLACWGGAFLGRVRSMDRKRPEGSGSPGTTSNHPPLRRSIGPDIPVRLDQSKPVVFIDKNYVVLEATERAAQALRRGTGDLRNIHLLDLEPSPDMMRAIQDGKEADIPNAFRTRPSISVLLKPDPDGTFLFLEEGADPSKA